MYFENMKKFGHRYGIQYFHLIRLSLINIIIVLNSTPEKSAFSFTTETY